MTPPASAPSDPGQVSLFRIDAAVFILLGALVVLWPLALTGGRPFMMVDTAVYADQGARIWSFVQGLVGSLGAGGPASGAAGAGGDGAVMQSLRSQAGADDTVRSLPYAAFVGLFLPLGTGAVLYAQAVLLMTAIYGTFAPAMRRLPVWGLAAICAVVVLATPLPTMASYLMPDIFGAVIMLFAVRLVLGLGQVAPVSRAVLIAIALLAVLFHYGNLPFGIALIAFAALLQAGRRRALQTLAVVAGGMAVVAIGLNFLIGHLAFDSASAAPNRAPIVLARSIEDGPARWLLEEDCASATPRYALCEYWGTDIPTNVGAALWEEGGMDHAPPELYSRIRAEEIDLVLAAFRAYPAQQIGAFLGNAFAQFVTVWPRYAQPGVFELDENGRRSVVTLWDTGFETVRPILNVTHRATYLLGVVALVGLLILGGDAARRRVAAVVLGGLALNATIFGGLSAPVPRYQARVAWTALAVALLLLAEKRSTRTVSSPPPQGAARHD